MGLGLGDTTVETLKEAQPENTKVTLRVNGTVTNQEEAINSNESQTTMSNHPPKGTIEDVIGWPEWYSKNTIGSCGNLEPVTTTKERQPEGT
jgi:hypothetical protein